MFRRLKKELESVDNTQIKGFQVPRDPQAFYEDFGCLPHPRLRDESGDAIISRNLTSYQIEAWKYPGNLLVVKSNKVGMTTSFSLEDFQTRLLPESAGFDVLLVAQTVQMVKVHIHDLRKMIGNSKKYSRFLIERPENGIMRGDVSNSLMISIRNPYDPNRPSRIIGIGSSEATAYSWKYINHIHMSDVSLLQIKDPKKFFGALYSRLANTNGVVKIETIPNGQQGEIWDIYNRSKQQSRAVDTLDVTADPEKMASKFRVMEVPAREAVQAGLISQEFLDQERRHHGETIYQQLYECKFLAFGNQFYKPEMIHYGSYGIGY